MHITEGSNWTLKTGKRPTEDRWSDVNHIIPAIDFHPSAHIAMQFYPYHILIH